MGLMELLSKAATVAMVSFVVSSMLAMGAALTVSQIVDPLRNARLVMLALVANFVFMPLGAFAWRRYSGLTNPLELDCFCSVARPARRFCLSSLNLQKATCPLVSARWSC